MEERRSCLESSQNDSRWDRNGAACADEHPVPGIVEASMKRAVVVLSCVLVLVGFTCRDSGPHDPPPRPRVAATNADGPVVEVPDIVGADLAVAVDRLEEAGLETDLSGSVEDPARLRQRVPDSPSRPSDQNGPRTRDRGRAGNPDRHT